MISGKMNCLLDCFWGSSGKGKTSAWLADHFGATAVSSSNYPNAGHTARFEDGTKFVAKALPTAGILKRARGMGMECFVSPGSGFDWVQLFREWDECGRPAVRIHGRASIVDRRHREREASGAESTKHIASTMQGSAAAMVDKVLRKADCVLAGTGGNDIKKWVDYLLVSDPWFSDKEHADPSFCREIVEKVSILDAADFRRLTRSMISGGQTWLHEGSQGYALSIDHGSHYPHCTSRNCTLQAAMDHMAVPPALLGDVYLNLRTYPIRVGNVVEGGEQVGYSGDFYPDCEELTWEEVARRSGMPAEEADILAERERTTVTKRVRRVSTFSYECLKDAVATNGATKLVLNFVQYLSWKDAGVKGGPEALRRLSKETRSMMERIEDEAGIPIVLVGTGADHEEMISLL